METIVKTFEELTTNELYEILKVRFQVFVMEQHCFYLDMDDIDYKSFHIILKENSRIKAYARLFPEETAGVWHVGRVLTVDRGIGLGKMIMKMVISKSRQLNAKCLRMDAQCHAVKFYEDLGFSTCSESFLEAGIPHIMMQMNFNDKL